MFNMSFTVTIKKQQYGDVADDELNTVVYHDIAPRVGLDSSLRGNDISAFNIVLVFQLPCLRQWLKILTL